MSKPKYQAINSDPTLQDIVLAFNAGDYMQWAGATAALWTFGMVRGSPARFAMAGVAAGLGFTFGSIVAFQNSRGRLMGYRPNGNAAL
jgi:NADH-ubiquinone oxidoreductase complex I, 21 kDa subunit